MTQFAVDLARCFPDNSQLWKDHLSVLLDDYNSSGLAPPNLIREIGTGDPRTAYQCIVPSLVYRHLSSLPHLALRRERVRKSGQKGPDFSFECQGKLVWVEVTVPSPGNDLSGWGNWLDPLVKGVISSKSKPYEQILSRWTTALGAKREKTAEYLRDAIISTDDCIVVAINSCMLHEFAFEDIGRSRFPTAVEAVLPIGPIAAPIEPDGSLGEAINVPRFTIPSRNGAPISTANFLNPAYAHISALAGSFKHHLLDGGLDLVLLHNPLATNKLPPGILGARDEYITAVHGNYFTIQKI